MPHLPELLGRFPQQIHPQPGVALTVALTALHDPLQRQKQHLRPLRGEHRYRACLACCHEHFSEHAPGGVAGHQLHGPVLPVLYGVHGPLQDDARLQDRVPGVPEELPPAIAAHGAAKARQQMLQLLRLDAGEENGLL